MNRVLFYAGLAVVPVLVPPGIALAAGNPGWLGLTFLGAIFAVVVLGTFGLLEWRRGPVEISATTFARALRGLLLGALLAVAASIGGMFLLGTLLGGFGATGVGIAAVPVLVAPLTVPVVGWMTYRAARRAR